MDFIEQLQSLASKISKYREIIQTEEATKQTFVLPFIAALGYDHSDPTEVIPEFTADVGIKKGEKVDYAILREGKVIMLFECKKCGAELDSRKESQIFRYFNTTEAKIAVLTDGIIYKFYTDLENKNKMDTKPFMEFNLLDIQDVFVNELKRFSKKVFDLEAIITVAKGLKYTREIKLMLGEQMNSPTEEFVRLFASKIYNGTLTQPVRQQFAEITKQALIQFINDKIRERLKSALTQVKDENSSEEINLEEVKESKIVTTQEELEGYYIVKSILRNYLDPQRIAHRDTQNCFGILLDDKNYKPICRFRFDRKKKWFCLLDNDKKEIKTQIDSLDDIYQYSDQLKEIVLNYEKTFPLKK